MIDQTEFNEHESESATWIALADLMTGLMAIFLVMALIILTNQNRKQVVIITAVTAALKDAKIEVVTDPKTGDVSIVNRDLLFNYNSATLSPRGKLFLDRFVPQYSKAIFSLDDELSDEVVRIVVEGRTSRSGNQAQNMALSLLRANAVVQYIYAMPWFPYKQDMQPRLTAVGRGMYEAGAQEDSNDREVLFRFQFKGVMLERSQDQLLDSTNASGVDAEDQMLDGLVDKFVADMSPTEAKTK